MSAIPYRILLAGLLVAGTAEAGPTPQRPDPADPAAAVPPATYESAFTGFTPFAPPKRIPWPRANVEVGGIPAPGDKAAPAAIGTAVPPSPRHQHKH